MTFAQLNSSQRSILTMLCTGQTFNTAELGRGTVPKQDAQAAAQILMEMRDAGLIFSSQKAAGAQYASWRASDYGKKVFEGRPDENPAAYQTTRQPVPVVPNGKWIVYQQILNSDSVKILGRFDVSTEAYALAERLAAPGSFFFVAKLVGRTATREVSVVTNYLEQL